MTKAHTSVTIDVYILEQAKRKGLNISEICQNALSEQLRKPLSPEEQEKEEKREAERKKLERQIAELDNLLEG